ncbi:hypothetical protein NCG97_00065 [Streptomyces lydicamycinicus]|uniref:hypothetical protein n=1 Tax=Streptomyces lydicamycinicus TaxID=1546107 RepID=UPI002034E655|nr:hypothetical protein [Streptomyces lydicamycinicus]URZ99424.1 hypothetical protein NCG97_00065 [Streptomyces lydicamycinicus]
MTDDYAAMSSGAIMVILVLGFVEMHALAKSTQKIVHEAVKAGVDTDGDTLETRMADARYRSLQRAGSTWSLLCLLMTAALILTFLWAAIDGHGPARLLAGYTLIVTITSLCFVLATAFAKVRGGVSPRSVRRRVPPQRKHQRPDGRRSHRVASPPITWQRQPAHNSERPLLCPLYRAACTRRGSQDGGTSPDLPLAAR